MPLNLGTGYGIDTLKPGSAATGSSLDTGLVAYWNLNEASGTRFDASFNMHDLSVGTLPGSVAGLNGNAANFVLASTQYLQCPDVAPFTFVSGSFTVAGWVKFITAAATRPICAKFPTNPNAEFQLRLQSDNKIYWYMYNLGTPINISTAVLGTPTAWNFVVAGRNGNTQTVILNNGTPVTGSFTGTMFAGTGNFTLGANGQLSTFSDLAMDDWGVWNRWLSAAEITTLYNAGAGREYPLP